MKAALRVERLIHKSVFFGSPTVNTTAQRAQCGTVYNTSEQKIIDILFVIYTSDALFYTLRGL